MIGTKPSVINVSAGIYIAPKRYATYDLVKSLTAQWTGSQIYIGQNAYVDYITSSTNFWKISYSSNGTWADGGFTSFSDSSDPVLYNKKLSEYPDIVDEHSGIVMKEPATTTWSYGYVAPPLTSDERGKYIKWYIDTYGNPGYDWSQYDIHHIRPREYGGTNDYYNLMPIDRWTHQNVVNPWWTNY